MKFSIEQLAERLTSELGVDAVSTDPGSRTAQAVDGRIAKLLCRPASAAEVTAALRICAEAQAIVIPWGGGTAMALGNAPRRADVVMDLKRLDRVIEHDPANLTATVQSGMTLSAAQSALAEHKQFVPFDAPFSERATVGGIVAANLNGPRRSFYGSVRDLVIGMKVALANGELIKAGGKVVKNVAGYDMCKLFVGSLGTLGIITEVTLRMAPIAESTATVIASGDLPRVQQFTEELSRSPLLPAAITLMNDRPVQNWRAAVWCEGFGEAVARQRRDLESLANRVGARTEILLNGNQQVFWDGIRDFPLQRDRLVCRITLPRAAMFEFIQKFQMWRAPAIVADAAAGTLWFAYQPKKSTANKFAELESMAQAQRGHAVLFAAPAELKQGLEVWGSSPLAMSLMREIKRQFDPNELLNPGRFVGNL
jgi:glycolate oxidase FAD binding subunit